VNTKITVYITNKNKWTQELNLLRSVLLQFPLEETIKWGGPVYMYRNKNIIGLSAFNNYCGLWFFQGVFLNDNQKVFVNAQEGKTQAMRQWRFHKIEEINIDLVKKYICEAINNSEEGKEFKPKRNTNLLIIPEELQLALDKNNELMNNFTKLTVSKKREYIDYISQAKKETTKHKRINKITPMIINGVGLHDKYR